MLMKNELKAAIEAILFVSSEKISAEAISLILELGEEDVKALMQEMMLDYEQSSRGIQLIAMEDGYILGTKPEYASVLSKTVKPVNRRLSPAALETLAIIAYKQPITRLEIEQIRGVKTDRVVGNLLEKGVIKEAGRKEATGKPILFETTHEFLRIFGLNSLNELPVLEEEAGQVSD
ncbi:MAG: SMC-Scp complex subunit ScpB [Bacillota bacterium]|nr:SMC-Scp complex subunit ScpB [Bacillota bacterium]